jgi:hypothetical protein
MRPKHLDNKTGEQIVEEAAKKFEFEVSAYDDTNYIKWLEKIVLLAVKDALLNANYAYETKSYDRAITFLNTILPCEEKK